METSRESAATNRPRLVLATANAGKVAELAALLGEQFAIEGRPSTLPPTVEDGDTLEENALLKAREVHEATGALALSDDTGLFVEALGGRPGVHTARFAGPEATSADNIEALIDALDGVENRRAWFRTVIAVVSEDGSSVLSHGEVEGEIAPQASGVDGFGYDPVFIPTEPGTNPERATFAEMSRDQKSAISHRGRALARLSQLLDAD